MYLPAIVVSPALAVASCGDEDKLVDCTANGREDGESLESGKSRHLVIPTSAASSFTSLVVLSKEEPEALLMVKGAIDCRCE